MRSFLAQVVYRIIEHLDGERTRLRLIDYRHAELIKLQLLEYI